MAREDYEVVIGLETHVELATKTKIFCNCSTEFGKEPGSNCCPVCLAFPGTMPVLNEKVVEYAVSAGLATNCKISNYCWQDRKNYFYPDMPPAYQISQTEEFICQDGFIEINGDNGNKKIRLHEIHIEADAGKLIHSEYSNYSLVDLNRAGVPLIEIVSKPDLKSSTEVENYLKTLKAILEYIEISDCKMQEGSMRADINISVRKKGDLKLGSKIEMKNMNSFKFISKAINYEAARQIDILEKGGIVTSETVRWDEATQKTIPMREKDSNSYRTFPDPELLPIVLTEEYIENIKKALPELPKSREERYIKEYALSQYDANQITASKKIAKYFDEATSICGNAKLVANWIMSDLSRKLNETEIEVEKCKVSAENLALLITLIEKGTVSTSIAKKVFDKMFETGKTAKQIVEEEGLIQITDEDAIREIVVKVLNENTKSVEDFLAGKDKAIGFIVGQTMKQSKGKASPILANKLIIEELNKIKDKR